MSARDKVRAMRDAGGGDAGGGTLPTGPFEDPRALVAGMVAVLAEGDAGAYAALWVDGTSERDLRYAYDQARKAYDASDGAIAFDRWGDAHRNPDADAACAATKVFLKRSNTDGSTTTRPINLVKEAGGWKLKSGMI